MLENVLISRSYMLKYLGVKCMIQKNISLTHHTEKQIQQNGNHC